MAVSRSKKEEVLRELEEKFSRYVSLVFINYSGIGVKDLEKVRKELYKEGIDLLVTKKTLLRIALEKLNIPVDIKSLTGPIAVVIGYKDEVAPARRISRFAKELKKLGIVGGILEGRLIDSGKVRDLAQIPSREELLARVVGSIQAPVFGFVNVLAGNIRGLVQVLNAISQK